MDSVRDSAEFLANVFVHCMMPVVYCRSFTASSRSKFQGYLDKLDFLGSSVIYVDLSEGRACGKFPVNKLSETRDISLDTKHINVRNPWYY